MKVFYSLITAILLIGLVGNSVRAQKGAKPWTEWTEREARKMLDDSPWGKTEDNAYRVTTLGVPYEWRNIDQFTLTSALSSKYKVRFLSAQPIRQAFARTAELGQKKLSPDLKHDLQSFVDRSFDDFIVVAVDFEPGEIGNPGALRQAFIDANTNRLKDVTYLQVKDGQRLMLKEYKAPINDGIGAKFIFPRLVNGQPFVTVDSGELRFRTNLTTFIALNVRFKVSEMMHNGALEY